MATSDAKLKFDEPYNLVTSYCITPTILAFLRLLFALYTLVVLLFILIWDGVHHDGAQSYVVLFLCFGDILMNAARYFSYFTNLSYIGICAYFFASGVQTFFYARNLKNGVEGYPLQRWPRPLQYLHVVLYCTITTLPILVTIVFWVLLASSSTFATPFSGWSNISKHALNAVFALFELLGTNVGPYPWTVLPVVIVILGGYLGVAYITHATQGIYTYSFLNPKKQGKKLAAYIIGIAIGACIIFLIARAIIVLRVRFTKGSRKASVIEASEPLVIEEKKSESA
ncbi:uncharacterized protein LACBIDRAFT_239370 [Laccaria bicolor S238N-H82]|uniref:Predicted protein n=1 Tax=Laccaria bicolor (strain S238N-H82 / ATCC MYA-4686) TaxID=486041 RepID=B0DSY3_LACBS|nr:uncharacterized protein LACBIDRAFT_239370 [Laccaria bicolor S238N-H82]EDR02396.1 predicted protein [Laccaria bicolor S238N-H82]|eukprot:XP_001887073.1 predicted protein [Laccaria bicolor S238N-H82]